jgi:hypothetical protein
MKTFDVTRSLHEGQDNDSLQSLENNWEHHATSKILRYCGAENKAYAGVILIVDRLSATRDCEEKFALDGDHKGIAKPSSQRDISYMHLTNAIQENPITIAKSGKTKAATIPSAAAIAAEVVKQLPATRTITKNFVMLEPEHVGITDQVKVTKIASDQPINLPAGTTINATTNAPNSAAVGINTGTINIGPEEPKISFVPDNQASAPRATHPTKCVLISVDKPMVDAKFAVVCDRGCTGLYGQAISAVAPFLGGDKWGFVPGHPNIAAFLVPLPNPFTPDARYRACVESRNDKPVEIVAVKKLTLTQDGQMVVPSP